MEFSYCYIICIIFTDEQNDNVCQSIILLFLLVNIEYIISQYVLTKDVFYLVSKLKVFF